jgi:hypothetical protein
VNKRFDDYGFGRFLKLWPIIFAVVSLIGALAVSSKSITEHSRSIETNAVEHKEIYSKINRLEAIVELIPEMRADIKTILKERRNTR